MHDRDLFDHEPRRGRRRSKPRRPPATLADCLQGDEVTVRLQVSFFINGTPFVRALGPAGTTESFEVPPDAHVASVERLRAK